MVAGPETLERRCPRLGHDIALAYCLKADTGATACPKTLDCWWEIFDVTTWLQSRLSAAEWQKFQAPPPAKVTSLVALIEQARARQDD